MPAQGPVRYGDAADFQLIETLRWEPSDGFVRLERHLARLYGSAQELGFACDPRRVGEALARVAADAAQRVRLSLSRNGDVSVATQPFMLMAADTVWKLGVANIRLDPAHRLIAHKTTRRDIYMAARAEFPVSQADEVLLLNEDNMVCEGAITNLFLASGNGPLVTPALSCGLLPGVLRQALIESGKAVEGVVSLDDLRRAGTIFVGNSLRGLILARLMEDPSN